MPRRSRIALVIVLVAIASWWGAGKLRSPAAPAAPAAPQRAAHRTTTELRDALARSRARLDTLPLGAPFVEGDGVVLSGRVIDLDGQRPVGDVEVVFRSMLGESSTTSAADGTYAIRVAPGMYRAFVRDDVVLSVGLPAMERLPAPPSPDTGGVPDEALMPLVVARSDTAGIDLMVLRGGVVAGRVVDRAGRPIGGALVRAACGRFRPALATDLAETGRDGSFELRLPAGDCNLEPSHARFAGLADPGQGILSLEPGERRDVTLTLTAGCVISGRVVDPRGSPSRDGAIEQQFGEGEHQFAPAGRIEPDGTFRWATADELAVTLRAWPWKSPPSPAQRFDCRDGARFDGVVFQIPDRGPDLSGVLVDRTGAPVGSAFIDLTPLEPTGVAQQERTDEAGRWAAYSLAPGAYQVAAHAEGRGVAYQRILSPQHDLRLTLGGTGRLEGKTPRLPTGSFELTLQRCTEGTGMVPLPQTRRVVTVREGRFSVDDLPACDLIFTATWQGWTLVQHATIPSDGTAQITLDLVPRQLKTVRGVVRNRSGEPVAGVFITASSDALHETPEGNFSRGDTTTSDQAGAYVIQAQAGGTLEAFAGNQTASATVSAGAGPERIELVLEDIIVVEVTDPPAD